MAATNFTPIQHYRSATASATPSAGALQVGELAINYTDGKLFYKDNAGAVQTIGIKNPVSTTGTGATGSWSINAATAAALQTARTINGVSFDGTANITLTANTPNSVTFNNAGAGGASDSAFNGGAALTVSYNTVGAPSTTGANASGTWGINITGDAATATTANAIIDGAVSTSAKIADGVVTTTKIADGAVTSAKIADAGVTPAKLSQPPLTSGTAVTAGGTQVAFTDIPSWAKRITILAKGLSTSDGSSPVVQVGTGASPTWVTSGYAGGGAFLQNGSSPVQMLSPPGGANFGEPNTYINYAIAVLHKLSGNLWLIKNDAIGTGPGLTLNTGVAIIDLAAALTAIRIYANGVTFDAGTVNIMYE